MWIRLLEYLIVLIVIVFLIWYIWRAVFGPPPTKSTTNKTSETNDKPQDQ